MQTTFSRPTLLSVSTIVRFVFLSKCWQSVSGVRVSTSLDLDQTKDRSPRNLILLTSYLHN